MPEHQQTQTTTVTETTETTQDTQPERKSSLLTDILTIIGFAILFIIIIWGLVHLVELISSSYSPSKPVATIQVSAPAQMTSGESATISWNYSPSTAGSYAFLYQCQNGLTFQTSSAKDSGVPCGVAYTIGSASSSISLIPLLASTSSVSDTVSIVFIPQAGGSQVQGDATTAIYPASAATTTRTTTTGTKSSSTGSGSSYTGAATRYAGPADLAVTIISGYINGNGDGIVTFNIANVGGSESGSYTFSAQLPTAQPLPYASPLQAPLAPGAHVVSTLNFTDARSGGGLFTVSIQGGDSNTSDNYASMQISGPVYNNNYNYQEPYVQYPNYNY